MHRHATLSLMLLLCLPGTLLAQKEKEAGKKPAPTTPAKNAATAKKPAKPKVQLAFVGGTVLTGTGQTLDPGVVLVVDGKITKVGETHDVLVPKGYKVIDAQGYTLCPGFVVANASNVALTRSGSKYGERFDRFSAEAELLQALGITAYFAGGSMSSSRMNKSNAVIRIVRDKADGKVELKSPVCVTLDYASARGTRRAAIKKVFRDGHKYIKQLAEYHAKLEQWKKDLDAWKKREAARQAAAKKAAAEAAKKKATAKPAPKTPPAKKPAPKGKQPASKKGAPKKPETKKDVQPVAPTKPRASSQVKLAADVIGRKLPLRLRGRSVGQLRQIVALARALKIQPIIEGATEGWTMTGALAAVGSRVVVNPRDRMDPPVRGDRSRGWTIENAHLLDQGGVTVTIAPGSARLSGGWGWGITGDDLRTFRLTPAFAVRGGLSNEKALAGVTSKAAELLGVGDQVGSLATGRYADILFLTVDPLHYRTLVERVYIGGRLNYERTKATWFKHLKRRKP